MKNILTIDIDFISDKYLGVLSNMVGGKITEHYWDTVLDVSGVESTKILENKHNLIFILKYFLSAIKKTDNVVFGYYHDSILNHIDLDSDEELFIVNIDHHHDISYCPHHSVQASRFGECSEANWIVPIEKRIKDYVWIRNKNSELFTGTTTYPFSSYERIDAPLFEDVEWDYIYVALSPNYTAKEHWFYFYMFISIYESIKGKEATIDSNRFTPLLEKFDE